MKFGRICKMWVQLCASQLSVNFLYYHSWLPPPPPRQCWGGCIQNMLWQLYITHGICIVSLVQVASWRRHRKCTTVTHGLVASCTLQLFGMYRCFKCTGLKVCMGNLTLLLFRIQIQKQIYQLKTSYKAITFRTFHMMIVSQIIVINDLCFCPWQLHFHYWLIDI